MANHLRWGILGYVLSYKKNGNENQILLLKSSGSMPDYCGPILTFKKIVEEV